MKPDAYRPAGTHLLADLHGIEPGRLLDPDAIDALLRAAANAAGARILHSQFHTFGEALGVTGVVLLAESHISIHTWPEYGFAAADIFMCGSAAPQLALDVIEQALRPRSRVVQTIARGNAAMTPRPPQPMAVKVVDDARVPPDQAALPKARG